MQKRSDVTTVSTTTTKIELNIGPGMSGVLLFAWLISTILLWIHPESIPVWIFTICNIIFWLGIIVFVISIIILFTFLVLATV
jgi:hypothetical protein